MNDILEKIAELRLVPVVKIENSNNAVPLGQALLGGGLPLAEITFRTDAAEEAIRALTSELTDLLVGGREVSGHPGVGSAQHERRRDGLLTRVSPFNLPSHARPRLAAPEVNAIAIERT